MPTTCRLSKYADKRGSGASRGYDANWRKLRLVKLSQNPLCELCAKQGRTIAANTVDHIIAIKQDPSKRLTISNLQSLCKTCHDSSAQYKDRYGFLPDIGLDGLPIDENHPSYTGTTEQPFSIPHYVQPSLIPVHLVCGPPASGKSTYVRAHANPNDVIIDLDEILVRCGFPRWSQDRQHYALAMRQRDGMIHSLSHRTEGAAWLIVMAPTTQERKAWCKALGAKHTQIHCIETSYAECKRRITHDPERAEAQLRHVQLLDKFRVAHWWA